MWEISNQLQIVNFLRSVIFGVLLCLFYDFFRIIRKAIKHNSATVFFEDILYFLIVSLVGFCFLLATTNGELRIYVFIGIILGFCVSRLTVSKIFVAVFSRFFKHIVFTISYISVKIKRFIQLLQSKFEKILLNIKKYLKKAKNSSKKA